MSERNAPPIRGLIAAIAGSLERYRLIAIAIAISWGLILLLIVGPMLIPFMRIGEGVFFAWSDFSPHYIAAIAAMYDPIDWAHPLAISTLRYPLGSSLLLTDAIPLVTLPLRVLWQAVDIQIAPPLAMDLWVAAMTIISPLAIYRLARSLGTGRASALISGVIGSLIPALVGFSVSGSQGLASWPLLVILLAELARLKTLGRAGLLRTALLAGSLWWCHYYYGFMGLSIAGAVALMSLFRGKRSWALPAVGSLAGLLLIRQADIFVPSGFDLTRGGFGSHVGLLNKAATILPEWQGMTDPVWGVGVLLLFIIVQPLLWRRAPGLALGVGGLALLSIGSISSGGILPQSLFELTPLGFFRVLSRLFLPAAVIGVSLAPAMVIDLFAHRPDRSKRAVVSGALISTLLVGVLGASLMSMTTLDPLDPGIHLETRTRPLQAMRQLIAEHRGILFLPDIVCNLRSRMPEKTMGEIHPETSAIADAAVWKSQGEAYGSAWLGVLEGIPSYTYYVAAELHGANGEECQYLTAPPAGTLLLVSARFQTLPVWDRPWEAVMKTMRRCTRAFPFGPEGIVPPGEIIACSDNAGALADFERSISLRPVGAPLP